MVDLLKSYEFPDHIPEVTQEKLLLHFREYILVGGLPAAVRTY